MNISNILTEKFRNPDGWIVERMETDVDGHHIQIVRFNGNSQAVLVQVDSHVCKNPLPLQKVDRYVRSRI